MASMRSRKPTAFVVLLGGAAAAAVLASPAAAQTRSRWEIAVHVGSASGASPTGGTGTLPGPGDALTTLHSLPSRRASSWFFGDGAALLKEGLASFPSFILPESTRITPLDAVLTKAGTSRERGGSYGFRIGYAITPRLTAEFNVDATRAPLRLTDALLAGVEASRVSFTQTWVGLISTGGGVVFTEPSVASTATITRDGGRQLFTTGALTINLATQGTVIPYATIGAGVLSHTGDLPSVTLVGNYRFASLNALAPGRFPVNETDQVTIRIAAHDALTTVVGGGVKITPSARWSVRADVRAHISANKVDVLVDATPNVAMGTPAGAIASTLTPSLQFSNNPSTGQESNLSGPAIAGLRTFTGSGSAVQLGVTGGIFVRF